MMDNIISNIKSIKDIKKIILDIKKNRLENIIKFNRLVKNTCQKYQNNYFHLKSSLNLI